MTRQELYKWGKNWIQWTEQQLPNVSFFQELNWSLLHSRRCTSEWKSKYKYRNSLGHAYYEHLWDGNQRHKFKSDTVDIYNRHHKANCNPWSISLDLLNGRTQAHDMESMIRYEIAHCFRPSRAPCVRLVFSWAWFQWRLDCPFISCLCTDVTRVLQISDHGLPLNYGSTAEKKGLHQIYVWDQAPLGTEFLMLSAAGQGFITLAYSWKGEKKRGRKSSRQGSLTSQKFESCWKHLMAVDYSLCSSSENSHWTSACKVHDPMDRNVSAYTEHGDIFKCWFHEMTDQGNWSDRDVSVQQQKSIGRCMGRVLCSVFHSGVACFMQIQIKPGKVKGG